MANAIGASWNSAKAALAETVLPHTGATCTSFAWETALLARRRASERSRQHARWIHPSLSPNLKGTSNGYRNQIGSGAIGAAFARTLLAPHRGDYLKQPAAQSAERTGSRTGPSIKAGTRDEAAPRRHRLHRGH